MPAAPTTTTSTEQEVRSTTRLMDQFMQLTSRNGARVYPRLGRSNSDERDTVTALYEFLAPQLLPQRLLNQNNCFGPWHVSTVNLVRSQRPRARIRRASPTTALVEKRTEIGNIGPNLRRTSHRIRSTSASTTGAFGPPAGRRQRLLGLERLSNSFEPLVAAPRRDPGVRRERAASRFQHDRHHLYDSTKLLVPVLHVNSEQAPSSRRPSVGGISDQDQANHGFDATGTQPRQGKQVLARSRCRQEPCFEQAEGR